MMAARATGAPRRGSGMAEAIAAALEAAEAPRAKALPGWTAQDGPQRLCYESEAEEILYGGAAGGGKSHCAIALPLRWKHPRLRALILRRSTPQLSDLLEKARLVYKTGSPAEGYVAADPGATEKTTPHVVWTLSWGAKIRIDHCNDVNDWENYQGHEYQVIIFDELTQFLEKQYTEIKSRLRSGAPGLPRKVLATSNPGCSGHAWVFKRWGPWLDPARVLDDWEIEWFDETGAQHIARGVGLPARIENGKPAPRAVSDQVLYVARRKEEEYFSTEPFELDGVAATTRTFIGAKLNDNKALLKNDPGYRAKLRDHTEARRRQLEDGDWLSRTAAGLLFQRSWFGDPVDAVPAGSVCVRAWDKAATRPNPNNQDPDWTRGLKLAKAPDGLYYIAHLASIRDDPGSVTALMKKTAAADTVECRIRVPVDPGAAGVQASSSDVRELEGYPVTAKRVSGSKEIRAEAVSKQVHPQSTGGTLGRFRIVRGAWNEALLSELEEFPDGDHDDIVDALSDAFDEVKDVSKPVPPPPPRTTNLDTQELGWG